MRVFFHILFVCFCFAALPAQANDSLSIAVLDVQKLLTDSKAAKSIQKQLNAKREEFQKEFSKHEQELRDKEQEIIQQRATLSTEDFTKKRTEFEKKLLETRKLFQQRRGTLDQAFGKSMSELRKEILQIAAKIADDENIEIVLTREHVVIASKSLDITNTAMTALDKKVKKIELLLE